MRVCVCVCSALQKSGLAPSSQDCRALFLEFDNDRSNDISQEEFLHGLRVSSNILLQFVVVALFNVGLCRDH